MYSLKRLKRGAGNNGDRASPPPLNQAKTNNREIAYRQLAAARIVAVLYTPSHVQRCVKIIGLATGPTTPPGYTEAATRAEGS